MIALFGNANCQNCGAETRVMIEIESCEDQFLMLGDPTGAAQESLIGETDCDYCNQTFKTFPILINQTVSYFANENECERIRSGGLAIRQAAPQAGMEAEKTKELRQFNHSYSVEYKKMPYKKDKMVAVAGDLWRVTSVFKRESKEKDAVKRMLSPFHEEYWHEVENVEREGERKWIIATDAEGDNALLTQERPFLRENECYFDVSETNHRTKTVHQSKFSEHYRMEAKEGLAGVRIIIYNEKDEIEADFFGETIDEALEVFEEEFQQQEH